MGQSLTVFPPNTDELDSVLLDTLLRCTNNLRNRFFLCFPVLDFASCRISTFLLSLEAVLFSSVLFAIDSRSLSISEVVVFVFLSSRGEYLDACDTLLTYPSVELLHPGIVEISYLF